MHAVRKPPSLQCEAMDAILVVNAGSSSLKFQVFATDARGELECLIKGQMDGIGTRPRLRAAGPDRKPLIDRSYPANNVPDLPAATQETGDWLRQSQKVNLVAVGHRVGSRACRGSDISIARDPVVSG